MRIALVCLVSSSLALAGPPREGVVVQVADGEVVFDLGRKAGLKPGGTVRFYRRLTVKHPINGREMVDRFPIGEVQPAEVGELLSIARDVAGLKRPPKPGDFVVLGAGPKPEPKPGSVSPKPAQADPETAAVRRAMVDLFGAPREDRIARWEGILTSYPEGQFAASIGREIEALRVIVSRERVAFEQPPEKPEKPATPPPLVPTYERPKRAVFGQPVELAVAVGAPDEVEQMRLLVRRRGERLYSTRSMTRSGENSWRAHLPERALTSPGRIDYAIEAVRKGGKVQPLVGTPRRPKAFEVTPLPPGRQPPGHSQAMLSTELVNFHNGGAADQYLQTEATFGYDLEFGVLHTVRVGVGSINGSSLVSEDGHRYVDDDDEVAEVRELTLSYAFAEGEVDLNEWTGLAARVMGGNHHATRDATREGVGGIEGRVRVGRRGGSRLVLGGGFIGDVGDRFFADMHIAVFDRFPIVAGASVTNLPLNARDGFGLRLRTRTSWRVTDLVAIDAVLGWNARTINHHGVTVGGGLTLDW